MSISDFCQQHFSRVGAWRLNRVALGWDLLRAPFNVFFAPIWILAQLLSWVAGRLGADVAAGRLAALPPGLATAVHRRLRDQLLQHLVPPPPAALNAALYQNIVRLNLQRYLAARAATAELSANLAVLLLGFVAFRSFTPGGLGLGREVAQAANLQWLVSQFWAGDWLGGVWYQWFPPATPAWLILACIAAAMALIALVAALSGLLADPVQYGLGIHQRRLRRFVSVLERDIEAALARGFQPPEPYWARLFDALDWWRL